MENESADNCKSGTTQSSVLFLAPMALCSLSVLAFRDSFMNLTSG
jgi:hypothetical protein